MKRTLLLALCGLFSLGIWAVPRSAQEAQQLASDYLRTQGGFRAPAAQQATLKHCYTAPKKNGAPAFYVFNRGTDNGFVIVSAESRTHTILGYSTTGHFDEAELPSHIRAWLEGYQEAITFAASLPEKAPRPNNPKRAKKSYTPIAPLCATQWGQRDPYNLQCPMDDDNERSVTGCVATAAAQIMKYHNYPTTGKGSHSYYWYRSDNDSVLLSVNFASTTYDWSNMQNTYTNSSTTAQKNAVAKLMHHCGVACNMNYSSGGSGAYTPNMLRALVENFRYNAAIKPMHKDYMKEEDFLNAVVADLQAGRPVFFNGRTKSDEGHAFVCDGLDADGRVHINWGWYGNWDSYFYVSALDPEDQGTGGSASNEAFTEQVTAYTNIVANEGGLYQATITVDSLGTPDRQTRFGRYDDIRFNTTTFCNRGLAYWEGQPVWLVYQNGSLYTTVTINFNAGLNIGWYYYDVYMYPDFSSLPTGQYEIVPAVTSTNSEFSSTPAPIWVKYIGEYRCPMTVTNDSILLTPPEAEEPPVVGPDVPDPTTYTYTQLAAYYYPESSADGAEYWKLQLSTADFYDENATEEQMLILFGISSKSPEAFVGSYPADTMEWNQCYYATLYKGNIGSYQRTGADESELTMVYHSNTNQYLLHYRITIGNQTFVGQTEIATDSIWGGYGQAYGTHEEYEEITLNHTTYTALTTSYAMQMINNHSKGWASAIPYAVEGEISQLLNTPAQIKQYKNCRLYISDGTTELYSYNTKWLNNTNFSTGNEIALGGQAVIAGLLKYYNATTKEIFGYFCHYEAPGSSTKMEDVTESTEPGVRKVLRDGQLLILRNGETYTASGERL